MRACPDCNTVRPAAAFERPRIGNPANDRLGLAARCNDCLSLHRERKHYTRTHRAAAMADPSSDLARQWREVREARLATTARVTGRTPSLREPALAAYALAPSPEAPPP